jgi:hypothetical protein
MAPLRVDGAPRRPVPIWVVRAGGALDVRSWRGTAAGWFRAAQASHAARVRAGGVERDVDLVEAGDDVDDASTPPTATSTPLPEPRGADGPRPR